MDRDTKRQRERGRQRERKTISAGERRRERERERDCVCESETETPGLTGLARLEDVDAIGSQAGLVPCGYQILCGCCARSLPRATDSSPSRWENLGCLVLYQQHVTLLNWCHDVDAW